MLYGLGAGLRGDMGILLPSLVDHCGLTYQEVSLCIAVMNLMFGATQPLFGMLAARTSNRLVLWVGAGLVGLSLLGMMGAHSWLGLLLALGLCFGAGTGALAFGLILSSAMRRAGPERAMIISGMLNAAAGLGSFALSPLLQGLLSRVGLQTTLALLLVPVAILVPLIRIVTAADTPTTTPPVKKPAQTTNGRWLLRKALGDRSFRLLCIGFCTCGFHMVLIESHLFSQYISYGIDSASASWAFSLYGIATIGGALLSGWLSTRVQKSALLVAYYGLRAIWTLLFLAVMPKTLPSAIVFSLGLGLTGDATVSPAAGIVNERFNLSEAATLIGVLFLFHQVGGFLSAWLGGLLLENGGSYAMLWGIDILLCTVAALASTDLLRRRPSTAVSIQENSLVD